jgi:hypothetical protein
MKLSHFLVAAALCSTSAALAQTTAPQTTPRTTTTASPSTVPSGTTPEASNPKGAVSASEVFTTGSPDGNTSDKRAMKHSKKDKSSMSDGKGKMKTKM